MMKKRLSLPKSYPQPSEKLPKFSWPLFSCWTSWMNDLSLYVYVKKWIIVVIVNKLILVYFTWLIQNFVNHNRNVLLKRNDVWLMPLNIFVYVFHVHSPKDFICLVKLEHQKTYQRCCSEVDSSIAKSFYPIHTLESGNATN